MTSARLRVLPATVLVTLVVVLAIGRARRRHDPNPPRAIAARLSPARPPDSGTLGAAPLGTAIGKVSAHAAQMLHGDRRHTHRARGRGPVRATVAWSTEVGGPIETQVTTSPDEKTLYVASLDGAVTALGRDGRPRWKVALGDRIYSTPTVGEDGTIYVGTDAKRFVAITPAGAVRWKLETDADADTGSAIAQDGKVIFAAGKSVYAVRPGGDVAWRFQAKGKVYTAPAIGDDGTVFFGAQDHRAYALSAAGALAWSADLGGDVDGAPAIGDDGAVFFGTDADQVVRLGARGEIVWRADVGGFARGALSIGRDGDLLAGVYGPLPRQVRIGAANGKVMGALSVQGTGAREFGVHGGALEDDGGALYFGAQDDAAYAVERNGEIRWRFATGGDVDAPLTMLSDGALLVPSDDGKVYLLAP